MPRLTPAVLRALDIVELFIEHDGLTAREVIDLTGYPRASVHELLATLVVREWLRRSPEGVFSLGVQPYVVGSAYSSRLDLRRVGTRIAREVAASCAETVNLGVRDGSDVIYLVIIDSTQPVRLASRAAGRLPVSATAIGKALLLGLSAAEIDSVLPAKLPQVTEFSITSRQHLKKQLEEFRSEDVCFESGESTPGVACAAAPIRGPDGSVVAALSIAVPQERWANRRREEWAELVRAGAAEISHEMGAAAKPV